MPKKYGRTANFIDVDTGEIFSAKRGTKQFDKYRERGYLTKEQVSHRKEYQPDIIEPPPEEYTDYPEADEQEMLKERIEDMYQSIWNKLGEIPDDKLVVDTVSRKTYYINLMDSKQELINALDELYSEAESDDEVNAYLKTMLPKIEQIVTDIAEHDSKQSDVQNHLTLLANILSQGTMSDPLSKSLGNMFDYQGNNYSGFHQYGSSKDWDI